MPVTQFHTFKTRKKLADTLAETVAEKLVPDIETGQFASIALSGGATPRLFLDTLGKRLGQTREMVYFALVDERCVPPDDPRSNEAMIKQALGLNDHPDSEFLSLYQPGSTPEQSAELAERKLLDDEELPFDVLTLGMGLDGHTASFFPQAENLDTLTAPDTSALFAPTVVPATSEPRISMTLPPIVSAGFIVLHIEGQEKRTVFEGALLEGDAAEMPIRYVLRHPQARIEVFWAP